MTDKTLREAFDKRYPGLLRLAQLTEHDHGHYSSDAVYARELLKAFEAGAALASSPEQAEPVPMCHCKDRAASACPGEWEPGCDLGNNPAHVRVSKQSPDEVAATLRKVAATQPAAPVGHIEAATASVRKLGAKLDSATGCIVGHIVDATAPTAPAPATDALAKVRDIMAAHGMQCREMAEQIVEALSTPPLPQGEKRWPFVESPGQFADRLGAAYELFGSMTAAVRCVLIENPPTLASPPAAQPVALSDEQLANAAYQGFDAYWTEDCKGSEAEAWAASAKAVLAACGIPRPDGEAGEIGGA